MNEEHTSHPARLYGLLGVAASSVITGIFANIQRDVGSPLLMIALLFWILLGLATGIWIIRGRSWRTLTRNVRLRLGIACFAITWGGVAGLLLPIFTTPSPGNYVPVFSSIGSILFLLYVAAGFSLALLFVASLINDRQPKRDEGDIFP